MKPFIALIVSCLLVLVSVLPAYAQKVLPTSAGKSQVVNRSTNDGFAVGDIKLAWNRSELEGLGLENCVIIFVRNFRSEGGKYIPNGLKFAIVEKGDISDIEDPSTLNYQDEIPRDRGTGRWRYMPVPKTVFVSERDRKPGEPVKGLSSADHEKYTVVAGIRINYNEILCLQLGNKYVAIKPTSAVRKYLSWEQTTPAQKARLAQNLQERVERAKQGTEVKVPRIGAGQTMDYEWAYWKFIPSRPPISKDLIVKSASQSQAK